MKFHLRKLIREILAQEMKKLKTRGSKSDESYDEELLDDSAYKTKSVYVPDDVKEKINSWAKDMGLTKNKR